MGVEIRQREVTYHETGVGVQPRTEVVHELGAEVDGVWVPFASVSADRVGDFKARADAEAERSKAEKEAAKTQGSGGR